MIKIMIVETNDYQEPYDHDYHFFSVLPKAGEEFILRDAGRRLTVSSIVHVPIPMPGETAPFVIIHGRV
jgi:hypothetical protein